MSAWIVSKRHIDLLVSAAIAHKLIDREDADETGRMLWRECLTSVAYRYPNDADGERPGPVAFRDADVDAYTWEPYAVEDPYLVLKQAHCYDYQSCEHPGYADSSASNLMDALCEAIDASADLPAELPRPCPAYDAAPWGV